MPHQRKNRPRWGIGYSAATSSAKGPRSGIAVAPALLAMIGVYLVPIAVMALASLRSEGSFSLVRYRDLLSSPSYARVLVHTLEIATWVTVLCVLIGYPLAYWLTGLHGWRLRLTLVIIMVPFLSSVIIRSYAWVVILASNGLVNNALVRLHLVDTPLQLVFNNLGTLVGMVQLQLPLLVLPLYSVMRAIDKSLPRAAESLGASPVAAFVRVFLPLSLPGVAAGATLVFILSIGYYVAPALLGPPGEYMYAQDIFVRVSTLGDFEGAAASAVLLFLIVGTLLIVFRRPISRALSGSADEPVRARGRLLALAGAWFEGWTDRIRESSVWRGIGEAVLRIFLPIRHVLLATVSVLDLIYLCLPMPVIIILGFSSATYLSFPPPGLSTQWFENYFHDPAFTSATWNSLVFAASAGIVATVLGTAAAGSMVGGPSARRLGWLQPIFLAPLIVPEVVFGVGFFRVAVDLHLLGSPLAFVAAYTVMGLPYAVVVMCAARAGFDQSLEQAAASLGASPARVWRRVTLPLLAPAAASAFVLAFLRAWDELVVGLFISSADIVTLPVRMWQDIQLNISPRIAAVSVVLLAATVCGVLVVAAVRGLVSGRVGQAVRRISASISRE